ncbi:hypothetical protein D022_0029A, partial [Vibrio parahaemolyticus 12310]
MIGNEKFPIF